MLTDFIDRRTANVYGIYGHLGGGKSLTAVELIVFYHSLGWSISTNILVLPLLGKERYQFIEDFQFVDFWKLPVGAPRGSSDPFRSLIVIDECAEFFDQFSSTSLVLKNFLSWLRHSSKRGQFVFLVVQKPEFIAKSLRLLINKWIVCDDMDQFRLPVLKVKIPFTSDYVSRRVFDRYGNCLSKGFNFANKRVIGRLYDTSQSIAVQGRQNDYNSKYQPLPFYEFREWKLFLLLISIIYTYLIFRWI